MHALKILLAIALLSITLPALADPPGQVGRLSYLSGTVSFAPAEANSDWGAAPLNRPITTGDRLWADRDGRAEIRIGSTAIRVNALTSLDVLTLDDSGTQLRLAQGSALVNLRRLDASEHFEINTPAGAVLLMQPGIYRIGVDPAGAITTVLVQRGQADVLSANAPFSLRDNQFTALSAQGLEAAVAPVADEFDAWAAARDRQEERLVSTRYVPQEMTGYEDLDQYGAWNADSRYGNVWTPAAMPADWAPYRYGRWVWISPWGWTWVDNAPWGFAPYHYGRWVWLGNQWAWTPGARVARPVYAPALVAFVGGDNWSVGIGGGPAVGWVPLGWREPFIPWYSHSPAYVRNVNITQVTNVNVINQYTNAQNVRYINRNVPRGTTVVTRDAFVSARHVQDATLNVPAQTLAAARVMHEAPVIRPDRFSMAAPQSAPRLPAAIAAREVIAVRSPTAAARFQPNAGGNAAEPSRVRVLPAQQNAALRRSAEPPAPMVPAITAPVERRERATERSPAAVLQPTPRIEPPSPTPAPRAAVRAAPATPATAAPPAAAQAEAQRQQEQQARAQARQLQQQQLQEQKDRQHQAVQQRAQEVQRQRDQQMQHLQQVEQQKQLQHQQQQERARAERAERQAQSARPAAPPPQPRPPAEKERDKSQPR